MKEDSDKDHFDALCVRYLSGESDGRERETLVAALKNPELKRRFESLQESWNSVPEPPLSAFDAEKAFRKLDLGANHRLAGRMRGGFAHRRRNFALWALPVLLAGLLALRFLPDAFSAKEMEDIHWVEKYNPSGQRSALLLSDGTRITLNAESTLLIPGEGSGAERVARLQGEAFFEVAHDDRHPFTVETGSLRITVLGTKFNATGYADDDFEEVSLLSGRLLVSPKGPSGDREQTILTPGEAYRLNRRTGKGELVPMDADRVLAWTQNRMIFKDERMDQVIRALTRRFGIPVVLAERSTGEKDITGSFDREGLVDIVRVICLAAGLRYDTEWKNGSLIRIVISPEK